MINIIQPKQYKRIPWKNGKGNTLELAINQGGDLNNFDWRISIASVTENGTFSNFTGYSRNLVLIEGDGIKLQHDDLQTDQLNQLLSVATFDGGNNTLATLKSGSITDFNLITKSNRFRGVIETFTQARKVSLKPSQICFIYSHANEIKVVSGAGDFNGTLHKGHLMQLQQQNMAEITLSGANMIVVYINKL